MEHRQAAFAQPDPIAPEPAASRPYRIALVGNYAPKQCGIATFTTDIADSLTRHTPHIGLDIYALADEDEDTLYENVAGTILRDDPNSYAAAARAINESDVDAVWLQHEFGIFGGTSGAMVGDFVDRLAPPLIVTPHTILDEPSADERAALAHLLERASRVMVMSARGRELLDTHWSLPPSRVDIIEHGAPDRPFGRTATYKDRFGLETHKVMSTFGLLGHGKGLENAIAALPGIVARHPDALYRIIGATHPALVAHEGESYRDGLKQQAEELGVADHIEWVDAFLDTPDLLDQIEACDVYLTPYPGMQQSTSGTLAYAVALGRAVVSTPYAHARELLADDVGILVEPGRADAIEEAVNALFDDPDALAATQRRAWDRGRETIWPRFAENAAAMVARAAAAKPALPPALAVPGLAAVRALSDATGMLQHSIGIVPDRDHGYCVDDNARALILANLADGLRPSEREALALPYASFLQHAWNADETAFRNFMRFDRSWCEERGSDDSNGRAIWALGHTARHGGEAALRDWAATLYERALPFVDGLQCPRATAFAMLGAAEYEHARPGHPATLALLERGGALLEKLLGGARRPDWAWFEPVLGYDNPRLSQALIEAGAALERDDFTQAGLETLRWICEQQRSASGKFRPIGSETFGREYAALPFDQQPLEAQAAIEACLAAARVDDARRWHRHARAAWRWFFGANDRGVVLADIPSGRCRDGITPRGRNENCGAESVLAFQLSFYSFNRLERLERRRATERAGAGNDDSGDTSQGFGRGLATAA